MERADDEAHVLWGSLGLPRELPPGAESRATELLALTPTQLRAMTAEECGEAAFVLSQLSFFLQRAWNAEAARARLAQEAVSRLVARSAGSARGASHEERRAWAVAFDPAASEYDAERVRASVRAEQINFLAARASEMARALSSLQATRRSHA